MTVGIGYANSTEPSLRGQCFSNYWDGISRDGPKTRLRLRRWVVIISFNASFTKNNPQFGQYCYYMVGADGRDSIPKETQTKYPLAPDCGRPNYILFFAS